MITLLELTSTIVHMITWTWDLATVTMTHETHEFKVRENKLYIHKLNHDPDLHQS